MQLLPLMMILKSTNSLPLPLSFAILIIWPESEIVSSSCCCRRRRRCCFCVRPSPSAKCYIRANDGVIIAKVPRGARAPPKATAIHELCIIGNYRPVRSCTSLRGWPQCSSVPAWPRWSCEPLLQRANFILHQTHSLHESQILSGGGGAR